MINARGDQLFYEVAQGEWKAAKELRAGDVLYSVNGEKVEVESIDLLLGTYDIFNIEVSENRNDFVNGILIHNGNWFDQAHLQTTTRLAEEEPVVPVVTEATVEGKGHSPIPGADNDKIVQ